MRGWTSFAVELRSSLSKAAGAGEHSGVGRLWASARGHTRRGGVVAHHGGDVLHQLCLLEVGVLRAPKR
jgi:hypothetical protein